MIRFQDPAFLLLLLAIPVLIAHYVRRERRKSAIRFSDVSPLRRIPSSPILKLRHSLIVLRCLAIALLVMGISRPQAGQGGREILTQGLDIVLALDVSTSMDAQDLGREEQSRLEICKEVVAQFVKGRTNDRLGLVVFAGESYTQCPLTLDYGVFLRLLEDVNLADERWDGTAIGTGIATAVNRLRSSTAKSRVIILLTDGVNNRGAVDPITAAMAAKAMGVRIYTIGAGTEGTITQRVDGGIFGPRYQRIRVEIDEETLREVAETTGGRYYRATSEEKLEAIYKEIGEMETSEILTRDFVEYEELFPWFLVPALGLIALEILLGQTRFRRLP